MTTQQIYTLAEPPVLQADGLHLGQRQGTHKIYIAIPSEMEINRRRTAYEMWLCFYDMSVAYYADTESTIRRLMKDHGDYYDLYIAELGESTKMSFGKCGNCLSHLMLWDRSIKLNRVICLESYGEGIGECRRRCIESHYTYSQSDEARYREYWRGIGEFMTDSEAERYREKIYHKTESAQKVAKPPVVCVPRHGKRPITIPRNLSSSRKGLTSRRQDNSYHTFKIDRRITLVN